MSKDKKTMCVSKMIYDTRAYAQERAYLYMEARGIELRVYYCPFCGSYHLTSRKLKEMA